MNHKQKQMKKRGSCKQASFLSFWFDYIFLRIMLYKYKSERFPAFPAFLSCGLLDRNGEWVV